MKMFNSAADWASIAIYAICMVVTTTLLYKSAFTVLCSWDDLMEAMARARRDTSEELAFYMRAAENRKMPKSVKIALKAAAMLTDTVDSFAIACDYSVAAMIIIASLETKLILAGFSVLFPLGMFPS